MKTDDFKQKLTSNKLKENIAKQFGTKVNLDHYNREQLEDMRNKLRTKLFQQEHTSGINDLLTNETYQKNKAMLDLLNTRIKEMLGEDIKALKSKLLELTEGKKANKDYDGDGKVESPKDEVWGSRAKAAAKAGKPFKESEVEENRVVKKGTRYDGSKQKDVDADTPSSVSKGTAEKSAADRARDKAIDAKHAKDGKDWETRFGKGSVTRVKGKAQSGSKDDDLDESTEKCNHTPKGKNCPVHGLKECGTMEANEKPSAGMSKAEKSAVVKKAKAGGDIGKPGKGFKKVAAAAKKGGAKNPEAVAAAAMWKQQAKESLAVYRQNVKIVNESLQQLINEDEEEKAQAITAASDMANDFTSWMQRVGQYQTKVVIELADEIRHNFGAQQAEAFKQSVSPALAATLETLTAQREIISNAIAVLAGGENAMPMGQPTEPQPLEANPEPSTPDAMNQPADEFAASDAAAGAGATGREIRENTFLNKIIESHSIISKLAK